MNYIFFGTPKFAVIILEALIKAGYTPALIVTAPDKPKGRGHTLTPPPVKILAKKHDIPVLQPATLKSNEITNAIAALQPDLFVVAAYGKIIPNVVLAIPKKGGINVHPSLLPTYRGPSPIQAAILNGDDVTGVTIMLMDEEMDHGPILAQKTLSLRGATPQPRGSDAAIQSTNNGIASLALATTGEELSGKLAHLGAQLLIETIPQWLSNKIKPQPQDHAKATYTRIITKEDGRINWQKSAEKIERMIRAYTPWPSAWTTMSNTKCLTDLRREMRVKILKAKILQISAIAENRYSFYDNKNKNDKNIGTPGTILKQNGDLLVACGNGFLMVEELQVEGKKPMSGAEFLHGYCFSLISKASNRFISL